MKNVGANVRSIWPSFQEPIILAETRLRIILEYKKKYLIFDMEHVARTLRSLLSSDLV